MLVDLIALIPWEKFITVLLGLTAIQAISFYLNKFLGRKFGLYISAFLSGIISSTAVVLVKAHEAKDNRYDKVFIPMAVNATAASLAICLIVVLSINFKLGLQLVIPITGMTAILILSGFLRWMHKTKAEEILSLQQPIKIKEILLQTIFLMVLFTSVAGAQKYFGETGSLVLSFLAGLFELHGLSIATSQLEAQALIPNSEALNMIFTGILASLISKSAIAIVITRNQAGIMFSLNLLISAAVGWSLFSMMTS